MYVRKQKEQVVQVQDHAICNVCCMSINTLIKLIMMGFPPCHMVSSKLVQYDLVDLFMRKWKKTKEVSKIERLLRPEWHQWRKI